MMVLSIMDSGEKPSKSALRSGFTIAEPYLKTFFNVS
jgi:hypothetical protein